MCIMYIFSNIYYFYSSGNVFPYMQTSSFTLSNVSDTSLLISIQLVSLILNSHNTDLIDQLANYLTKYRKNIATVIKVIYALYVISN